MSTLIGEGNFGCVYWPPLKCKNERYNKLYGNDKYVMEYIHRRLDKG